MTAGLAPAEVRRVRPGGDVPWPDARLTAAADGLPAP